MAPTAKPAAKPAATPKAADSKVAKPKSGPARNYDLGNGIYRFSRARMYHKKAIYKFIKRKAKPVKRERKPLTIEKPIGGEKNGGKRIVLVRKRKNYYPTQDKIRSNRSKKAFKQHTRSLRPSLVPGTVCILLAGLHKGKRVVFLKQLPSGLLLVTGPFLLNACPLRRVSQRYVIGTSTRLDISGCQLPDLSETVFRRSRTRRAKKDEGDIFSAKKQTYKVSEERKALQKQVDDQIMSAVKKHPDRKMMYTYLSAMFGLRSSQYPHRLRF